MKPFNDPRLAKLHREHPTYGWGDESGQYFRLNSLHIIASNGGGWDHVSVSLPDRCPTWDEMCKVKELFFDSHECVVQYHPAASEYVNHHEFCLHLWRPQTLILPTPPSWMVGPK